MEVTYQNYVDIIIEEARSWIGVPFHHQGRTKSGCDCIGIVLACARRLDYKYEDYTRYGRLPHKGLLGVALEAEGVALRIPGRVELGRIALPEEPLCI